MDVLYSQSTRLGFYTCTFSDDKVTHCRFTSKDLTTVSSFGEHPFIRWIADYFEGISLNLSLDVFDFRGVDRFTRKVLDELISVPYGETVSYSELAQNLGNRNKRRAVASSLGKNPFLIYYPCHRVIKSDGSIGGYSAGVFYKKALIVHEKIKS